MTKQELEAFKHSPASNISEVLRRRWSPRTFEDKPVPNQDLRSIFEAAGWAASSFNEQPWRFFVGRKGDATFQKISDALVEFNRGWAAKAPVLILSIAKKTFTHNGTPNAYGIHDTGAATAYLSAQATALGLHTHSMAGFDKEAARKSFNIPDDFEIGAVTALGYLGEVSNLSEDLQKQEIKARTRKPLSEFVYSEFEQPAEL